MPLPDDAPVTEWLIAWGQGDQLARERLMEAVYGDLRRRAAAFLRRAFTMTLRYAHLSPSHLRGAVARLEGLTRAPAMAQELAQNAIESSERAVSVRAPVAQGG